VLEQHDLLRDASRTAQLLAYTTGSSSTLSLAFSKLLQLEATVHAVSSAQMTH
jgi:hypothetical protein